MKSFAKIVMPMSVFVVVAILPAISLAQTVIDTNPSDGGFVTPLDGGSSAPIPSTQPVSSPSNTGNNPQMTGNNSAVVQIQNPLKYTSISQIVTGLIQGILYVGAIVCALYIIWAGFLFVKARGSETELEEAKKTITHAVIGTAIILGANVILVIVQNTINAIKS